MQHYISVMFGAKTRTCNKEITMFTCYCLAEIISTAPRVYFLRKGEKTCLF